MPIFATNISFSAFESFSMTDSSTPSYTPASSKARLTAALSASSSVLGTNFMVLVSGSAEKPGGKAAKPRRAEAMSPMSPMSLNRCADYQFVIRGRFTHRARGYSDFRLHGQSGERCARLCVRDHQAQKFLCAGWRSQYALLAQRHSDREPQHREDRPSCKAA